MKQISVSPLTRVEGHGQVELGIRDGRLTSVRLELLETPRLFEGLVRGRPFAEVPALVCRICAICSAVHRVAAASALEAALGLTIPPLAARVRELLLLGGHLESHALHLFCLILPDLRGVPSLLPLLAEKDPVASGGLELKRFANRIQEVAGGRPIHPVNVEVGGIVARPASADLVALLRDLELWQPRLDVLLAPFAPEIARYPVATPVLGTRLSVAAAGDCSLQGERLALSDGRAFAAADYRELLAERAVSWSNAAQASGGIFLTGALARQENRGTFFAASGGIHANNAAQAAEVRAALGRCRELLGELLAMSAAEAVQVAPRLRAGVGTTVIEAPRGLLVHHYALDAQGRVAGADVVTPTVINQRVIEAQLLADLVDTPEAELAEGAQRIVRAFDPCISCAVHLLRLD